MSGREASPESVGRRFERAWREGRARRVEEWLAAEGAGGLDEATLAELLHVEFRLRRGAGESPEWEEYAERFPASEDRMRAMFEGTETGPPPDRRGPAGPVTEQWPPLVGGVLADNYEILEFLGEGGLSEVYRAQRLDIDRVVAIKLLKDRDASRALLNEASAASRAGDHVNIATVYHVGRHEDRAYLEMQFVDGRPLEALLLNGPLSPGEARDVGVQIARALEHAWRANVVHRDIKTTNVMVTSDGVVKVVDFGLARKVEVGDDRHTMTISGTAAYMPPEQWNAGPIDTRADQYSLGVTLFRVLTGSYPFGGSKVDLMRAHCGPERPRVDVVNPAVPAPLADAVVRMMAVDPDDRFDAWGSLITALERFDDATDVAQTPPPVRPSRRRARLRTRPPIRATAITAGLVGLLAVGLVWFGAFDQYERQTSDALQRMHVESTPADELVVVLVDQESKDRLAAEGPLSRETLATTLALLGERKVPAVGVDVLFVDPGDPFGDEDLAANTGVYESIVHAVNLGMEGRSDPDDPIPESWSLPIDPRHVREATRYDLPIPVLREQLGAGRVGHVGMWIDQPDGTIRRVPHLLRHGDHVLPSLSLAAVMRARGIPPENVSLEPGRRIELRVPDGETLVIPVDDSCRAVIDFTRPVRRVPLWRVHEEPAADGDEWSRDVVFLGSALPGDYDVGAVPTEPKLPLVEAHAIAAANVLSGRHLVEASFVATLVIVLALVVVGAAAGGFLPHVWGALATLAAIGAYGGVVLWAFGGTPRLVLPVITPLVSLALGYVAAAVVRNRSEAVQQTRLADLLGRSLPPRLVRRFLRRPESVLGPARRSEVSVLCVRIGRPDRFGQRLEAEDVLELLEPIFAAMTESVQAHEGTIEWLSADGCCAILGDPDPVPDHVARAIDCGWRLRTELLRVVKSWTSLPGRETLRIGIGIDTGYVTAGHVGNDQWLRYTAVGSAVDGADRLARESLAADHPNRILVSDRTRQLTASHIETAPTRADDPDAFELVSVAPRTTHRTLTERQP